MELAGNIKDFSVIEIAQFIWISKRTGKLLLYLEQTGRRYEASVFFVTGVVTAAFMDSLKGREAFFAICEAENGSFRFLGEERSAETNVMLSMDQLLLEASGRIKLYETLRREIPSSNIVYSLAPEFDTFDLVFDSKQWAVIGLIDGRRSLGEISKELGMPEFDIMRTFYSLLQVGVIKRVAVKQKTDSKAILQRPQHKPGNLIAKIIEYLKKL